MGSKVTSFSYNPDKHKEVATWIEAQSDVSGAIRGLIQAEVARQQGRPEPQEIKKLLLEIRGKLNNGVIPQGILPVEDDDEDLSRLDGVLSQIESGEFDW